jgi:hypothetical protein
VARAETIRVTGYRETARALGKVNRGAKRALYAGLRAAAEPIAGDARSRLASYQGISLSTIRPSAQARGVFIVQRARRVTGLRPDFGALQMRQGLIPALENHEDDIVDKVEDAFALLARTQGFR